MNKKSLETPLRSPIADSPGHPSVQEALAKQQSLTALSYFGGPVPHPTVLAEYEKILPGIAKKFLEAPSIEAEHRRAIENQLVAAQINLGKRGQKMAFSLGVLVIGGALPLMFLGHNLSGFGLILTSLAALVSVFFYSKRAPKNK